MDKSNFSQREREREREGEREGARERRRFCLGVLFWG